MCFEIWESGTFKFCLRKSAKAEASCVFEFLGWGPPVPHELQLMNLFPQNFFYCASVIYTHPRHFTDVCEIKERRKGRSEEGRKEGQKEGKTRQQEGRGKGKEKEKMYMEKMYES